MAESTKQVTIELKYGCHLCKQCFCTPEKLIIPRVYNKEGGRVSYYTIVLYYSCMETFSTSEPHYSIIHECGM